MEAKTKYNAIIHVMPETETRPQVVFRHAGEEWLHVEYGNEYDYIVEWDYMLNFRVQMVSREMEKRKPDGLVQTNPVWRSVSYNFDPHITTMKKMVEIAKELEEEVGGTDRISQMSFAPRYIELPMTFEDSQTKKAVQRYLTEVKPGSIDHDPVHLSNLTWLAQCNGFSREEFKEDWLSTNQFVFCLGFTIGFPVFAPVERTRALHVSKLNPPRTWTPRSAICVGGIYSVETPGGYGIIGRTIPVINLSQNHPSFKDDPILFRAGDILRFYEVDEAELLRIEKLVDEGSSDFVYQVTPTQFEIAAWLEFEREHKAEIEARKKHIDGAFAKMPVP